MRFFFNVADDGLALECSLTDVHESRVSVKSKEELSNYLMDMSMKYGFELEDAYFMFSSSLNWPGDYNAPRHIIDLCNLITGNTL